MQNPNEGSEPSRGGRRSPVALIICMILALLPIACNRGEEITVTNSDLMKEFYTAQLETLMAVDRAFQNLSQEYYQLDIEYEDMGRPELAALVKNRAAQFHKQHLEIQSRIGELQIKKARASRGERPAVSPMARLNQSAPARTSVRLTPTPTPSPRPRVNPPRPATIQRTAPAARSPRSAPRPPQQTKRPPVQPQTRQPIPRPQPRRQPLPNPVKPPGDRQP